MSPTIRAGQDLFVFLFRSVLVEYPLVYGEVIGVPFGGCPDGKCDGPDWLNVCGCSILCFCVVPPGELSRVYCVISVFHFLLDNWLRSVVYSRVTVEHHITCHPCSSSSSFCKGPIDFHEESGFGLELLDFGPE